MTFVLTCMLYKDVILRFALPASDDVSALGFCNLGIMLCWH